jgi:hypothetical protein
MSYGPDLVTGRSYSCLAGAPELHFDDVPAADPFCKHIHYLWAKGVASGCGPTLFCNAGQVTRGEMAKLIVNTLHLTLYGP